MVNQEASQFLQQNHLAALSTVYKLLPYVAIVYYVADDDFSLYFLTQKDTDKSLNLAANSNVAVVIGLGPKHIALQGRGHATRLEGQARQPIIARLGQTLHEKKISNWPALTLEGLNKTSGPADISVYKIKLQHLTFFNLDDHAYPHSLSTKVHRILP